ncbi:SAGA-associated factor 11 [Linum perenne]
MNKPTNTSRRMAFNTNSNSLISKPKKGQLLPSSHSNLCTLLFFIVLFTIPALFVLRTSTPSSAICSNDNQPWSGDLRAAEFSWNRLSFMSSDHGGSSHVKLKIAVFSRKWPIDTVPGGMERHAFTLHSALARRGHEVHVFTSPIRDQAFPSSTTSSLGVVIHSHEGESGKYKYNRAWELFEKENNQGDGSLPSSSSAAAASPFFDVIHSESVALPYWRARNVPTLVVTWHGIAYEALQSSIYQDLTRNPKEAILPEVNTSLYGLVPKLINEIRFFHNYAQHVAISNSCGEILRDVYQIPKRRVHVIVNGVDENEFGEDKKLGTEFRSRIGVPMNASLVLGVAGRLVKDKGHPLLFEAISKFITDHPNAYLVVAGSGPWEQRYRELGPQVLVLGSMAPSELKAFYNSIDVFVNPTLRPQGLDLTLMEAMMSGTPVMASRFASIKGTIIVDNEFGFMFSPNVDSLLEVLEMAAAEGAERLAQRGDACREYAASMFTATKMALAHERLFLCAIWPSNELSELLMSSPNEDNTSLPTQVSSHVFVNLLDSIIADVASECHRIAKLGLDRNLEEEEELKLSASAGLDATKFVVDMFGQTHPPVANEVFECINCCCWEGRKARLKATRNSTAAACQCRMTQN